jgi:hypothetical protein
MRLSPGNWERAYRERGQEIVRWADQHYEIINCTTIFSAEEALSKADVLSLLHDKSGVLRLLLHTLSNFRLSSLRNVPLKTQHLERCRTRCRVLSMLLPASLIKWYQLTAVKAQISASPNTPSSALKTTVNVRPGPQPCLISPPCKN